MTEMPWEDFQVRFDPGAKQCYQDSVSVSFVPWDAFHSWSLLEERDPCCDLDPHCAGFFVARGGHTPADTVLTLNQSLAGK